MQAAPLQHFAGKYYKMDKSRRIPVSLSAYFLLVLMLLLLPLKWVIAFLLAVFVHEIGHWLFIYLLTGTRPPFSLGGGGAILYTGTLDLWQEAVISAAGPIGSLCLLLLLRTFPEAAVCGFVHGIYNLLPIYPLDGGRILRCACKLILREKIASIICSSVEGIAWAGVVVAGLYCCFVLKIGVAAILAVLLMIVRLKKNTLQRRRQKGTIVLP